MVGGLLVAASAVGVVAAYQGAASPPGTSYVTVTRDVAAGEALTAADLRLVPIDLPSAQRRVSFTDDGALAGTVALHSLRAGQLVQSGAVTTFEGAPESVQVSVAVEPGRAMHGDPRFIRAGDRVDVLVTSTVGGEAVTRTVAVGATVVDVLGGDGGIGGGDLTVVLAVDAADAEAVAGGAVTGEVSLVRTTGTRR